MILPVRGVVCRYRKVWVKAKFMSALEKVNITFSERCNLRCPFCVCDAFSFSQERLTTCDWLKFIDEASAQQVFTIGISGGEPFVLPGLRQIIDRIVSGRMRFYIITNGSCIDDSLLEHIAATKRCDFMQFSLDGFEADHDTIRGAGVFKKATTAIKKAQTLGIKVAVNSVIARQNNHDLLEFATFLEELGVISYRLNLVSAKNLDLAPGYQPISAKSLARMIADFVPHFKRFPHLHSLSPQKLYWRQLRNPRPDDDSFEVCIAPATELAVRPDGMIIPCGGANEVILGSIGQNTLAELWNSKKALAFQKRLAKGSAREAARCVECPYRYYCRKYCPAVSAKRYCRKELAAYLREFGVLS